RPGAQIEHGRVAIGTGSAGGAEGRHRRLGLDEPDREAEPLRQGVRGVHRRHAVSVTSSTVRSATDTAESNSRQPWSVRTTADSRSGPGAGAERLASRSTSPDVRPLSCDAAVAASARSSSTSPSSDVSHNGSTSCASAPPGAATSTATRDATASRPTGTWSTTGTRRSRRLPTSTASSSARATATTRARDALSASAAAAYPVPLGTSATTGPEDVSSSEIQTPRPTAAPARTSVRPSIGTTPSRPVSAPAATPLTTPVCTGVSRATAPRSGASPRASAIRRTSAAAAATDAADPFAPRVGAWSAVTGVSEPSTRRAKTISVVALPMSMPATSPDGPVMRSSRRQAGPLVHRRRLAHEGRADRRAPRLQQVRLRAQLGTGRATGPEHLVEREDLPLLERRELRRPLEVRRQLRVAVCPGDVGLVPERVRADPDVVRPELAADHAL